MLRLRWRLAFSIIILVAFTQSARSDEWAQFRGPNAAGVYAGEKSLPVKFSHKGENLAWSLELGKGIACPIVSGGLVITSDINKAGKFAVYCLDAATGKERWRREWDTGPLPAITSPNEPASTTPACDGQRVYVYFSTLGMMALNLEDGSVVWQKKVQRPFYLLGWGTAHSPIIFEDMLIFNQDDDLSPFLIAYDKYTGEVRWRTDRSDMLAGYAVPVICRAGGQTDIVVAGSGKLKGYNPTNGEERWSCNTLLRTIMTTPAVVGDKIYVSVQSYGDTDRVLKYALLQWKDTNQDGKLGKDEFDKAFWKKFDKGDANKDGYLVDDEIDAAFQSPNNMVGGGNIIQSIRGGGKGDVTKTHVAWHLDDKSPSNIASPLVYENRVFLVKKGGISASFAADSGKTVFTKKRIRNLGNYYASPVAGDGKIYVTGENGYLVVLESGPKLKVLAKNDLGDSCIATPAIADGRIYVRTLNKLLCFAESKD